MLDFMRNSGQHNLFFAFDWYFKKINPFSIFFSNNLTVMDENEGPQLVFVYGTLKRGHPNHHYFEDTNIGRATFVGTAMTVDSWPLVVTTRFSLPYLLDQKGAGCVSIANYLTVVYLGSLQQ